MKIQHDKYYTPSSVAERLISITFEVLKDEDITDVIEPSAGNGAFSTLLDCTAYDLYPEHPSVIQADFLSLPLSYVKGRLFIGNPPYGTRNSLVYAFYEKCVSCGDYIAFILPLGASEDLHLYKFDLIYCEVLPPTDYSGHTLNTEYCIYKRPVNGMYNPRPDYTLNEVSIKEYRRGGGYKTPEDGYAHALCKWGAGVGKVPQYKGQYAGELYIYADEAYAQRVREVLMSEDFKEYAENRTSVPHISKMRVLRYLYNHVEGLTLKYPADSTKRLELF